MEQRFGFNKMAINEFESWLLEFKIARTVLSIQEHHTWLPSYSMFNGANHFELQKGMRNHHMNKNGWSDIGQHLTIFPDGEILTGRSFERSPACIYGQNSNAFCIENLGDFDAGKDEMTNEQRTSIIKVTAILCKKFGLQINMNSIVYHHWFKLDTGERNNGNGGNKSCPGTNFFGGNKPDDCETNFIPEVTLAYNELFELSANTSVLRFVCVNSESLNVRSAPHYKKSLARSPLSRGIVVRVFEIAENGWLKISSKKDHWVSGKFTHQVWKVFIKNEGVVSRTGCGMEFDKASVFMKDEALFVSEKKEGWYKINMIMEWLNENDLTFQ
ncbi:N-acetylmuramoyl-L-alanine amidase [Flavivirga amylovorans]|uniref:N-acetylmuramoyl-L-alanine amidase n=1 Tax=Flavivirga amylovorans TaxID=870486 RepID=A0ABT8WZP1_9FLAO|nr:N-acetylmuramoyl-L-alanine amidase [Flavivirga amylovorans]MDO5986844.1 N-acetylmuramoyl-L-alanine amidase [Flavivirga amylovorans]